MSSYEKIVTLFDTAAHAEAARANLAHAGFSTSDMSIISSHDLPKGANGVREPGLWHRLFGSDIDQQEATVYGKAVESGGVVLSLRTESANVPKAMTILNQHAVVDVKDRAEAIDTSRSTAASTATATSAAAAAAIPINAGAGAATARPITSDLGKSQVLRLAEEHLDIGKRLVEEGTTRIRRFVTEKPIEQKVTLHEEHAEVVRRAVNDPAYVKDVDWSDSTIEVRETAERAVVTKSARIAEEVVIGRTGSDRTETIRDTVRRQQVAIEHVPPTSASATTPTTAARP